MRETTLYSQGKDRFRNNTFKWQQWSAPAMVSPDEVKEHLEQFKLTGRKIECIWAFGPCYNLSENVLEEIAYDQLHNLSPEEREQRASYENIDESTLYDRNCYLRAPLLIRFSDGDVFEIELPQEPKIRMSMNCVPWNIKACGGEDNADMNVLFAQCLGQKILSVEVKTYITDKDPLFGAFCFL